MRQDKNIPINSMNGSSRAVIGTSAKSPPAITVDYAAYAHFLEGSDLSEDQKQALLQSLWNIVVGFVSLGFGVHPASPDREACGQLFSSCDADPDEAADALSWMDPTLIHEIEAASAGSAAAPDMGNGAGKESA